MGEFQCVWCGSWLVMWKGRLVQRFFGQRLHFKSVNWQRDAWQHGYTIPSSPTSPLHLRRVAACDRAAKYFAPASKLITQRPLFLAQIATPVLIHHGPQHGLRCLPVFAYGVASQRILTWFMPIAHTPLPALACSCLPVVATPSFATAGQPSLTSQCCRTRSR